MDQAIDVFRNENQLADYLSEEFKALFLATKQQEWDEFSKRVTEFELKLIYECICFAPSTCKDKAMPNVYDFSAKLANGDETSLADFKGQVLLVVNTASKCGFTPQYEGLEKLYAQHKDAGFSVSHSPQSIRLTGAW